MNAHRRQTTIPPIGRHLTDGQIFLIIYLLVSMHAGARASCQVNSIPLDDQRNRALLTVACGAGTVADGGTCAFEDTGSTINILCGTDIMVRDFVCANGQWLWASNARFCPQWQGCEWDGFALHCDGNRADNTVQRGVGNLDARLRTITIRNYSHFTSLSGIFGLGLADLASLTITNTSLQFFPTGALSPLSRLKDLYLHDNLITYIGDGDLPPFGNLEFLDLRNNLFSRPGFAPLALHAAMSTCSQNTASRVLVTDESMCTMYTDQRGCQLVNCTAEAQYVVYQSCDATNATAPLIKTTQLCDGVYDCPSNNDELYCQVELKLLVNRGSHLTEDQEFCNSIAGDIEPDFVGLSGLGIVSFKRDSFAATQLRKSVEISYLSRLLGDASDTDDLGNNFIFTLAEKSSYVTIAVVLYIPGNPLLFRRICSITFEPKSLSMSTTAVDLITTQSTLEKKSLNSNAMIILGCSLASAGLIIALVVWTVVRSRRAGRYKASYTDSLVSALH